MNAQTPLTITRRRFLAASVATVGVTPHFAASACTADATPPVQASALRLAGRRFSAHSRSEAVSALVAVVREYETVRTAQENVAGQFARETAPITDVEASILAASSSPLADPPGIDGSWQIVAGAAAVRTFHRGTFFADDRLAWTIVASRFDEDPNPPLPLDLARTLSDRFSTFHADGTPWEGDLWSLLPDEEDLGGVFRLNESFDREPPRM